MASLGRKSWITPVMAQFDPPWLPDSGILRLRLSDFPALRQTGGSVRIGTSSISQTGPLGLYYPVIVNRGAGSKFHALSANCTHAGCVVERYVSSSKGMECPCHGSRFAIDGSVMTGPANDALLSYEVQFDGQDSLAIRIPDLVTEIALSRPEPGAPSRFRISFLAFEFLDYEVQFRSAAADAWAPIPFSTTPNGKLDQTVLRGTAEFVTVYVQPASPAGFFAVSLRTKSV